MGWSVTVTSPRRYAWSGVRCSIAKLPGSVEEHVDDGPLGRREQHGVDVLLLFVAAAVAGDQLHACAGDGHVEDAGVRGVDDEEAHGVAGAGPRARVGLPDGEHDVAEAAHGCVGGPWVENGAMLPSSMSRSSRVATTSWFTGGQAAVSAGVDEDAAVKAHLDPVVLADVRVVPVDAVVGEAEPVGELATDGIGAWVSSGTPSYSFSTRRPCQWTVVSWSPSLRTRRGSRSLDGHEASGRGRSRCSRACGRSDRRCGWRSCDAQVVGVTVGDLDDLARTGGREARRVDGKLAGDVVGASGRLCAGHDPSLPVG